LANEPKTITKGITAKWTESFADYPATEWALNYYFRGVGTGKDVSATADGTDFDVEIPATSTDDFTVGNYKYQAVVSKDDEKYIVSEGIVLIKQGLAAVEVATTVETRSANQIVLDKIRAMISGAVDKNVQEYTINNRQLKHYTLKELMDLEQYYSQKVAQENMNSNDCNSPFLKPRKYRHVKVSCK